MAENGRMIFKLSFIVASELRNCHFSDPNYVCKIYFYHKSNSRNNQNQIDPVSAYSYSITVLHTGRPEKNDEANEDQGEKNVSFL